ncbi:hypothetical protein JRQ81_008967 [Phrynocephalus forsythii]|uniref:Integrase catalytic domain-containing protein n=1 Tax=Phrynocephalus forsythii TaxID=171643 RepID=A0A9Q1ASY5_9SAUR|nr:hypothetical protein JRQ81_008967 [Phrynocephalus forsythii]
MLIFVDDFSRYCFISLLTDEKEVHSRLALYVNLVEKKFQRKPTAFEMGNGTKPFPRDSEAYLEEQGILHGTAARQQNGTCAREMSSLLEMAAAMLVDAELPGRFWPDAIMTAAFLLNRLPVDGTSEVPYELWNGRAPVMDDLRVFGSLAYAYIPKTERHPLDPKREETVFLGYAARFKCYKVMNLATGEFCTRTVDYFDEERKAEKSGTVLETSEEEDFEPMSLLADRF